METLNPPLYRLTGIYLTLIGLILFFVSSTPQTKPSAVTRGRAFGDPENQPLPQIVGGEEAQAGDWPWQVALTLKGVNPYLGTICGGVLIHPHWVLTATHCVSFFSAADLEVIAGIHQLSLNNGQHLTISEIITHPDYTQEHVADIALLHLATPAMLTITVQTIPLLHPAQAALTAPGTTSTVTGWGTTSDLGLPADILRQVSMPIVSNSDCQDAYIPDGITITDEMLCAGSEGKDACNGDSGGPLVVLNETQNGYLLAGIVSFGPSAGCAAPGTYGGYTRVSAFIDWIEGFTGPLEFEYTIFLPLTHR